MENELLANIKAKLPELEGLLQEMGSHWEDLDRSNGRGLPGRWCQADET